MRRAAVGRGGRGRSRGILRGFRRRRRDDDARGSRRRRRPSSFPTIRLETTQHELKTHDMKKQTLERNLKLVLLFL